jgi:UDP-N-acetylmuramate--alanine ligase
VAEVTGPDLSRSRRVHVIGAGGSGMSAIGTVLVAMGHRVTGSDTADSSYLRHLRELGAQVTVGHDPATAATAEVVVRSTAIPDDDPDVISARAAGRTVWRRADVLAAICRLKRTLAVSGTHGKTTTSSMLAITLRRLGWQPSMIVGGEIAGFGPGAAWAPDGDWFVVEADESDGTFIELGAEAVIVTSVEADHLEHYGGLGGLEAAFDRFVVEPPGPALVCADDPGAIRLAETRRAAGRRPTTYGASSGSDLRVSDIELARGSAMFTVTVVDGAALGRPDLTGSSGRVELAVPGRHNVLNAAGVIALVTSLGGEWPATLEAIGAYRGVGRRFEDRGQVQGVSFVDGYDHLPTEVAAAIATAVSGGWSRIVAVFQPHRYSRTEALWADFADAFEGADVVVITGIYAAGEAPRPGVTGDLIADAVRRAHPEADVRYAGGLDEAGALVTTILRPGDLCLTLGAGDITTLADRIQKQMNERAR